MANFNWDDQPNINPVQPEWQPAQQEPFPSWGNPDLNPTPPDYTLPWQQSTPWQKFAPFGNYPTRSVSPSGTTLPTGENFAWDFWRNPFSEGQPLYRLREQPDVNNPLSVGWSLTSMIPPARILGAAPRLASKIPTFAGQFTQDVLKAGQKLPEEGSGLVKGWRELQVQMIDSLARYNAMAGRSGVKMGEIAPALTRAKSSIAGTIFSNAMSDVKKIIGTTPELLQKVQEVWILKHLDEVLKETGRNTIRLIESGPQYSRTGIASLLTSIQAQLGADTFQKVNRAQELLSGVYHKLLMETPSIGRLAKGESIQKYPNYFPLLYKEKGGATGKIGHFAPQFVKELEGLGTNKTLVNPLESFAGEINRRTGANLLNRARQSIAEVALKDPEMIGKVRLVDKVPTGAFLDYFVGGAKKYLQLDRGAEWIAKDLKFFDSIPASKWREIPRWVNSLSRAGFTGLSVPFIARNFVFDTLTVMVTQQVMPWQVAQGLGRTLKDIVAKDPVLNRMRLAGADFGFFGSGSNKWIQFEKEGNVILRNPQSLKRLANPLKLIEAVGHAVEMAPRTAVFQKAVRKGATDVEAAFRARRSTIDFSRTGETMSVLNDWYLFLNAAKEGWLLPFRAIRDKPKTAVPMLVGLSGAIISTYAYNRNFPEYKKIPPFVKYNSVVIMLPSTEYDDYGEKIPKYIAIVPNLREFSIFTAPFIYTLEKLDANNGLGMDDFLKDWGSNVLGFTKVWVSGWSPLSQITGTGSGTIQMPTQMLQSLNEMARNFDEYRHVQIVSDELLDLPAPQQYDKYTSKTAILVGTALNQSPKLIDYFVSNVFGSVGRDVFTAIDIAIKQIDKETLDPEVALRVAALRSINSFTPDPKSIPEERKNFLLTLEPAMRQKVLDAERIPEDRIPIITNLIRSFYRDTNTGGQEYKTAKEETLREYQPAKLASPKEELATKMMSNINDSLKNLQTHEGYDKRREEYRTYYAGRSAERFGAFTSQGGVPSSEVYKRMAPESQPSQNLMALSEYHEVLSAKIKESGDLDYPGKWEGIFQSVFDDLGKRYSQININYVKEHQNDWILEVLPNEGRAFESERQKQIDSGKWWDNYRGQNIKPFQRTVPEGYQYSPLQQRTWENIQKFK